MTSKTTAALAPAGSGAARRPPRRSPWRPAGRPAAGRRSHGRTATPRPSSRAQRRPGARPSPACAPPRSPRSPRAPRRPDQGRPGGRPGAEDGHPRQRTGGHPADGPDQPADVGVVDPPVGVRPKISVLPAPASRATSSTSPSASAASLSGMVRLSPRQRAVQAGHEVGQLVGGHLEPVVVPVQPEVRVRGPVQRRRQRVARSATRGPRSAGPRRGRLSCHSVPSWPGTRPGTPRTFLLRAPPSVVGELGLAGVEVDRHEVQPLAVLRAWPRPPAPPCPAPRSARAAGPRTGRCCTSTCSSGPSGVVVLVFRFSA